MKSGVFKGENGNLYLIRCPSCRNENYSMAVASGTCAFCGYKAKEEDCDAEPEREPN